MKMIDRDVIDTVVIGRRSFTIFVFAEEVEGIKPSVFQSRIGISIQCLTEGAIEAGMAEKIAKIHNVFFNNEKKVFSLKLKKCLGDYIRVQEVVQFGDEIKLGSVQFLSEEIEREVQEKKEKAYRSSRRAKPQS